MISASRDRMANFVYRCPNTGQTVQGCTAEEMPKDVYESIRCLACGQLHFVNPTTGKVLGEDDDRKLAPFLEGLSFRAARANTNLTA